VTALGAATDAAPTPAQWQAAARQFVDFYRQRVTGPDVILKNRSALRILWDLVRNKFDGFVDTAPLHDLIHREIQAANLRRARVRLQVGAVNMESGAIVYADAADPDIVDRIYASAAVPIV